MFYTISRLDSGRITLLHVVDKISEAMNRRQMTVGVFLDLSKAFDTIRHDILWAKLLWIGLNPILLTKPNKSALRIIHVDQPWL